MLISAYSTRYEHVPHDFTPVDEHFRWHTSGEQDAFFTADLAALEDYVRRAGAGQPGESICLLLRHVRDTQRSYTFTLDASESTQLAALASWASTANAILVAEGAVLDPTGRPLLAGAHGAPTGRVPLTTESTHRAQTIRGWLASAHGLQVPGELPPVRSRDETRVRDASDVGLRIIALVMTNDFAGSVIAKKPLDPRAMRAVFPHAMSALSPSERELMDAHDLDLARRLQSGSEAANELLWAIDRTTLGWPSVACQPAKVKEIAFQGGEQGFLEGIQARDLGELLDEYECLASLKWALDNRDPSHAQAGSGADPVIVTQRCNALKWLLKPQLAWDDVAS